ncbi:MAG: hypothetical protein IT361_04385 [Gemmatimonadaceae bacterium]|nr:hypothetical protein [Gemmatimonadaceae bacterium]
MTTTTWEHFVYGKRVQAPDGPIVPGSEHGCTGRSANFPMALAGECHPAKIGLGDRDPRRWAQCAWARTGGIVTGVAMLEGTPWVICGRQRERSEGGEGVDGRFYSEVHYAAADATQLAPHAIAGLAKVLLVEPRTTVDLDLAPLQVVDDDPQVLAPEWFDGVRVLLRGVMSGVPVNVQDWETMPEAFLQLASACLAAMPATLRCRIPVGAGLMTMDTAVAMASGMAALGGLRVIGGNPKNAQDFDLTPGIAYVEWIEPLVRQCTTVAQVAAVVARRLPRLTAPDAIAYDLDWRAASLRVARAVREQSAIGAILSGSAPAASATAAEDFVESRDELLEALLERALESRTIHPLLVDSAAPAFAEAWKRALSASGGEVLRTRRALAMLLGVESITDARELAHVAAFDVPSPARQSVVDRLTRAVGASTSGDAWIPLLTSADGAAWVDQWVDAASARLSWLALREAARHGPSHLLDALGDQPMAQVARRLAGGSSVEAPDLSALFANIERDDASAVDALVNRWAEHSPWMAFHIAECALEHGVSSALSASDGARSDMARRLVTEVLRDERPLGGLMVRALLAQRATFVSESQRGARLRERLGAVVGDPYSAALFGGEPRGCTGPFGAAASDYFAAEGMDARDADLVMQQFGRYQGDAQVLAVDLLRRWIQQPPARGLNGYPVANAIRRFAHGEPTRDLMLKPEERSTVVRIAQALQLPTGTMLRAAHDETLLDVVVQLWRAPEPVPLGVEQLQVLLEDVLDDPDVRARWTNRIRSRDWGGAPGWRWVAGTARAVTEVEEEVLRKLKGRRLLHLLMADVPLPDRALERITMPELDAYLDQRPRDGLPVSELRIELTALGRLLDAAVSRGLKGLVRDVAVRAVAIASRKLSKESVIESVSTDRGFLKRMIQRDKLPETPTELLQAALRHLDADPASFVRDHWKKKR